MLHAIRKNSIIIRKQQSQFLSEFFQCCQEVEQSYQQSAPDEYMPEIQGADEDCRDFEMMAAIFEGRD